RGIVNRHYNGDQRLASEVVDMAGDRLVIVRSEGVVPVHPLGIGNFTVCGATLGGRNGNTGPASQPVGNPAQRGGNAPAEGVVNQVEAMLELVQAQLLAVELQLLDLQISMQLIDLLFDRLNSRIRFLCALTIFHPVEYILLGVSTIHLVKKYAGALVYRFQPSQERDHQALETPMGR